ncbi:MAG: ABC transporter ATP-binding protein/permease [Treponema sp.]|jgi:ATP-binding cassette subfamily B protein|nr:ABC transporter ATP-binding protein/permease [Treponema sp.]
MKDFLRVLSYAGSDKKLMKRAVVLLSFSVLFAIIPFFLVSLVIDCFLGTIPPSFGWLTIMAAAILICLLLRNWLTGRGLAASHELAYKTLAGMRRRVSGKLLRMSMGDIQDYGTGSVKKNFVENIEEMELILAHSIPEGVANILNVLLVFLVMFMVDWRMALAALVTIIIGMIPVLLMMTDGMKRMMPWYAANKTMTDAIIEYISGMEVIKVFGQQGRSFKKYSESVDGYLHSTLDWYRSAFGYMTGYTILLLTALLLLLPTGVLLYVNGMMTLFAFILSILLGMSLGLPALRLISFFPAFPQLSYKSQKIESMFEIPDMPEGSSPAPENFDVAFENVSFAYKDINVISNVSLNMRKNTITALVGSSGAGKSTLAKTLMRFWDIKDGVIKIGGVDIRDLSFETLMDLVSYVSQDNFLFNASIMENIRYGRPAASDAEVIEAAKAAQCHEFIIEMDKGYDTAAGGSGDKLSGGQRQRICIARAMLKNAPIIVFDEATSFADPENEDKIQEALSELIVGKTVVIVAHRLSTIVEADNIVLLDSGKIADQGRHGELLERSILYRTLWDAHRESMDWDITAKKEVLGNV